MNRLHLRPPAARGWLPLEKITAKITQAFQTFNRSLPRQGQGSNPLQLNHKVTGPAGQAISTTVAGNLAVLYQGSQLATP